MSLSVFEILSINAVLVPALVVIWTIFLRKEMMGSIAKFRSTLKDYEKEKARELLKEIRKAERKAGEEEAMTEISEYTSDWAYATEAVSVLKNKENKIHKYGKYVILLTALTFLIGLYASIDPNAIVSGEITRTDSLYGVFALEIIVIFYWIWLIFDFGRILGRMTEGEREDIKETIEEVVEKIKDEEEKTLLI